MDARRYISRADDIRIPVALLLLHSGCRARLADSWGEGAVHIAAREGLLPVAQTLCAFGCCVDVNNKQGATPLHLAAKFGHTEVVRCLCLAAAPSTSVSCVSIGAVIGVASVVIVIAVLS
ncbi:PREDICTED: death-associated protein kinase dapk-1-like [Priapulus caudatus]|uniref:Death-associated protein kinase dapk-1-like n=1 Tax=Priapulus caudatus TaxID=37621 RepID=A0ABM1ENC3_PRICU|nr:PREDICTED: death-associated protein kinase dapk-1-like [Priapulus caudatus]